MKKIFTTGRDLLFLLVLFVPPKIMRHKLMLYIFLLFNMLASFSLAQEKIEAIKLVQEGKDHASENVVIDLTLRNPSETTLQIATTSEEFPLGCEVYLTRKDDMKPVPRKKRKSSIDGGIMGVIVEPNDSFQVKISLNDFFDLTLDGEYQLKVQKTVRLSKDLILYSNDLKVSISHDENPILINNGMPLSWHHSHKGCSLAVQCNRKRYGRTDPVHLGITSKNSSQQSINVLSDTENIFDTYDIKILCPSSQNEFRSHAKHDKPRYAELTEYGKNLISTKGQTKQHQVKIEPKSEFSKQSLFLSRIFDMSTEGIYGVVVSRKAINSHGHEFFVTTCPIPLRVGTVLTHEEMEEQQAPHPSK